MSNNINQIKKRDAHKASLVKKTAALTGLAERSIYRIINAQRENEEVLAVYMELMEGDKATMQRVQQCAPFNGLLKAKTA